MNAEDAKSEELRAIIEAIKERVRSGRGSGESLEMPDLMPIIHARDAAQAKVAAIGTVNPRAGGAANNAIQSVKKVVSRALDWHVREQVEFNRSILACVEALLEAQSETNKLLWHVKENGEWRIEYEARLADVDARSLRGIAEAQAGFQHRVDEAMKVFEGCVNLVSREFEVSLNESLQELQKRFWDDLERMRREYERLLHSEVKVLRQRMAAAGRGSALPEAGSPPPASASGPSQSDYDALNFAERFRGTEESVRERQQFYLAFFAEAGEVLDIGCGRGEFLEAMLEKGIHATGIDRDPESVAICRSKGLAAEHADLFEYLERLPDLSLGGIFSAQVVEHVAPERLPRLVQLAAAKLERGGVLAIETPNPACLAIFATYFYLDPSHQRPVPSQLLAFYMEEFGLGRIQVHGLAPAVESIPALNSIPADFREALFGHLDYAILGWKL